MGNYLTKIRQAIDSYTQVERKIAENILSDPKKFIRMSITDFANECGVSEASVVRFCKSIGLKGYQEFKIAISLDIANAEEKKVIHEKITEDDSIDDIVTKISNYNISAIQDTLKVLDYYELERAIDFICESRRIILFGIGASAIVAMDAQHKFARINIDTVFYQDSHMQITMAANAKPDDVVIGISNSGRTQEILKCMKLSKENGAKTVCITQYGNSPITEYSDVKLYTAAVETNLRSGAMASRIAQLNLIDLIFVGTCCRNLDSAINSITKTREVLKDTRF
ncbi:MAG: MurR/RpiR family transcriptional regulator [Caloramator sp.]|nr:MurR/RpiR family transcriptional regulator [Caloramator sp.]